MRITLRIVKFKIDILKKPGKSIKKLSARKVIEPVTLTIREMAIYRITTD